MTNHSFTFHVASEGDTNDILHVETRAFGYSKEARLVADLLNDESACPTLSLLARHNGKAVGHILFTRATFKGEPDSPMMHILAPLAVVPEYQGAGVGGGLIRHGIEQLKARRYLFWATPLTTPGMGLSHAREIKAIRRLIPFPRRSKPAGCCSRFHLSRWDERVKYSAPGR